MRALLGLALLWVGACSPVAPTIACLDDSDCLSGVCLAGQCVAKPDSLASDAASDTNTGTDALVKCQYDKECSYFDGPCTVGRCSSTICIPLPLPDEATCTGEGDGKCTTSGLCEAGLCTLTAVCDDGNPCTVDTCTDTGCVHGPVGNGTVCSTGDLPTCSTGVCVAGKCGPVAKDGFCIIQGDCRASGSVEAGKPCSQCVPAKSTVDWTTLETGMCNDGDACTRDDACTVGGACVGLAADCSGTSACSKATCDPAFGCGLVEQSGACDDGNPCTTQDICQGGLCHGGAAPDCDDGLPCTADSCLAGFGCSHEALSGPDSPACVADSDPCTFDVCSGGACIGIPYPTVCKIGGVCVPAQAVSDGNPCLFCDPGNPTQWSEKVDAPCDDGNACTFATNCVQGQCQGLDMLCDDKSSCTKDLCDPKLGCVFLPLDATCNDGSLCTLSDSCQGGKCVGTPLPAATCDDANPCTTDKCDATYGCSHKPNAQACNDGDPCTKGDQCDAGKCLAGAMACPCLTDAECDDGNPCTVNTCLAKGCQAQPLTGTPCSDNDACTSGDSCQAGWCEGVALVCNDKNPCTIDGCVAEVGCVTQVIDAAACNDGNACTSGDLCTLGKCAGSPKMCDDGNPCSLDTCNPASGACEHSLFGNGTACPDDGIGCTVDQCQSGVCNHVEIKADMCMIQGTCLSGGAINPLDSCLGCLPKVSQPNWSIRVNLTCNDSNPCTVAETCTVAGKCVGQKLACSDNEPCTSDNCNSADPANPCFWVPLTGACDDGNSCTTGDVCASGKCGGTGVNCSDSNPCTNDSCVGIGGCTHTPATAGTLCADDGLSCTSDTCADGACAHSLIAGHCKIAGLCRGTGDLAPSPPCQSCQPTVSTTAWSPASGIACDDGNPCTIGDACTGGACKPSGAASCDDQNPCTSDACSSVGGCSHTAQTGIVCSDGNACTSNDTCLSGACVGQAVTCPGAPGDAAACLLSACDPASGCAKVSACAALHECALGECLTGVGGKFGPLPVTAAGGPLALVAPTLRWQDTGEDWLGGAPRLWLAGQSSSCAAPGAVGNTVVVKLGPGGVPAQVQSIGAAGPGMCSVHPQLLAHPASFARTLLLWFDADAKACPGGALRAQVLGSPMQQMAGATGCWPFASSGAALAVAKVDANSATGAQVTGMRSGGDAAWQATGLYPDSVVSAGALAVPASPPAQPAKFSYGRPAVVTVAGAQGVLLPVHVVPQNGTDFQPYSQLQYGQVSTVGAQPAWQVVAKGIDVIGTDVTYLAVEMAWDSDAARVLATVSGTANQGGKVRGFLAHTRFSPTATSPLTPVVAQWFDPVGSENPAIAAFRLAELPGSTDFLTVWALPGSAQVWIAHMKAANDTKFITQVSQVLLSDFAPIGLGGPLAGAGGLSELVIAPGATRFSLAYEGALGTSVLTALVPK